MTRAALLRPMHLLVAAIGITFFALSLAWWVLPLTLVTYLALVYLAASSPLFKRRVLRGRESRSGAVPAPSGGEKASPEQHARKLPDGEIRSRIEAALAARDRALVAIENSDEATRGLLLQEVPPRLDLLLERLVDASERREQVAATVRLPETAAGERRHATRDVPSEQKERELRALDAQLSDAFEKVSALQPRVVRISTESDDGAREAAGRLVADLDETLRHLDTLLSGTYLR